MATWKKIIVSGSNAHLAQITSSVLTDGNLIMAGVGGALKNSGISFSGSTFNIGSSSIISTGTGSVLTGSFSGSFSGAVTGLQNLTQGSGITPFTYNGSGATTVAVSGASALNSNAVTKWNGVAFVNSSLTDNGTVVSGASSIQLTGANSASTSAASALTSANSAATSASTMAASVAAAATSAASAATSATAAATSAASAATSASSALTSANSAATSAASAAAAVAASFDAKGDLLVGTGAGAFDQLTVAATAGYVLAVNSATATGLEWQAPNQGDKIAVYRDYPSLRTDLIL